MLHILFQLANNKSFFVLCTCIDVTLITTKIYTCIDITLITTKIYTSQLAPTGFVTLLTATRYK